MTWSDVFPQSFYLNVLGAYILLVLNKAPETSPDWLKTYATRNITNSKLRIFFKLLIWAYISLITVQTIVGLITINSTN